MERDLQALKQAAGARSLIGFAIVAVGLILSGVIPWWVVLIAVVFGGWMGIGNLVDWVHMRTFERIAREQHGVGARR